MTAMWQCAAPTTQSSCTESCALGLAAGCLVTGFMNSLMQTIITFGYLFAVRLLITLPRDVGYAEADLCGQLLQQGHGGRLSRISGHHASCFLVLFSYGQIVATILRIRLLPRDAESIWDVRLSPHCGCYVLWHSLLHILETHAGSSAEQEKRVALFYAVVDPMLNPLIYSLRNKEVMSAMKSVEEI